MVAVTIQGLALEIDQPYKEGHVLKENEAGQLNQVYAENIRNNFAGTIRAAKEDVARSNGYMTEDGEPDISKVSNDDLDVAALQEKLNDYAAEYEFGARAGGGGRTADPVIREARNIALDAVKNKIKEQGNNLSDFSSKELNELRDRVIEANHDKIMEMARTRVEAAKALSAADISI